MYYLQRKINVWGMAFLPVFCAVALCGTVASAQNAPTPPAPQGGAAGENWRSKVGAAVAAPDTIKSLMASVPAEDRLVLVQELITAAAAVPGDANARLAIIKAVAINCIASVGVDSKVAVIAEVIATTPVAYLPHLSSELAMRFSPQANGLTPSQFQSIGEQVVQKVVERVAGSDDVNVRTACAVACFLTGTAPANDPILPALMAKVPESDVVKPVVVQSLAISMASGDAAPVYAAANVTPVVTVPLTTQTAQQQQQQTTSTGATTGQQQGTTQTTQQQPAGGTEGGGITLETPLSSYLSVSGHSSQSGLLTEFGSSSSSGSGQTASNTSGTGSSSSGSSTTPEGIQVVPDRPTCSNTNTSP